MDRGDDFAKCVEVDAVDAILLGNVEHLSSPFGFWGQQKAGATSAMRSQAAGEIAASVATNFGWVMPEPR
ncbi:hypothetical protein D3C83_127080 [compost metagenome]